MNEIRLGSLFDGIGVFPLAAVRCGIVPAWASEIEKAPISKMCIRDRISSLENMLEAIRYVYADAVEKGYQVPTTAELERWLWNHIVYAIRLGVVFLNRQELRFDIKKMLSAYSKC